MYSMQGEGASYDAYANDIARRLSGANSSEDVISSLRSMNLGDDYWVYHFKVTPCSKTYSHKWTLCPCAHVGETARRRDPRLHPYRAVLCPLAKMKKACPMGDSCMWSHNVFEHWLHPSRYKTRLCSFGRGCNRPICFFAHSAEELRTAPHVEDGADLDEREYLMHLMSSQQAGMMPRRGAMPPAPQQDLRMHHNNQHHVNMSHLNGLVMMNNGDTGHPPMQRQASLNSHMSARGSGSGARDVSAAAVGNMQQQQQQQQGPQQGQKQQGQAQGRSQPATSLDANSLLLGLQESLANFTMTADGGWSSIAGGVPGQGRISDPGQGHQVHINPMRHLNRISDSGQTLGLNSSKGIVDLEQLLNSALASAITQPLARTSSPSPTVAPSAQQQQPGLQSAALQESQSCPPPLPPPASASPTAGGGGEGAGPGPSGSGSSGNTSATGGVHELIAQLQEQGIVTSKEQLVASLTQLLAQLLVTS